MKPRGRSPQPFTERDLEMIKEYLETDKGLKEVAEKYGLSSEGLRYKVRKFRKQQELQQENETKDEKDETKK